jgi:SAM-dependent MidA family methyltransferase
LTGLADRLAARIAADGPIGVDDYMALANDHYYATRDPLGSAGDFVTAPEIHQMFGELVGAALADAWIRAGSPPQAVFAELGPGRGTLAADALRVMRRAGFSGEAHLVETSPILRGLQSRQLPGAVHHDDIQSLPNRPLLMVANEFFDALPIRQWIGEEQRMVTFEAAAFRFTADGMIREDSPARSAAARQIASHLARHGGVAIIIDYGHGRRSDGDTLQAVRSHRFGDPLEMPGEQDITAHVDFSALADAASQSNAVPSRVVSQGSWLETLGIGARAIALAAKNPSDTETIAAARRRLCDEEQMGRLFKVMAIRSETWPEVAGLQA